MQITKLASVNFNVRPQQSSIDTIILHHTLISKKQTIKRFYDPHSKVSAHYMIDKAGYIYSFVADDKRAWHAGISNWRGRDNINDNSIGIELVNNGKEYFPHQQMQSLVALCKFLQLRYENISARNIIGHADIAPGRKDDPSIYINWQKLAEFGIGLYPNVVKKDAKQILCQRLQNNDKVKKLQINLQKYGYKILLSGVYDQQTANVVGAFKQHFCKEYSSDNWDSHSQMRLQYLLDIINK